MDEKIVAVIAYGKHVDAFLDYAEYNFLGMLLNAQLIMKTIYPFVKKKSLILLHQKMNLKNL